MAKEFKTDCVHIHGETQLTGNQYIMEDGGIYEHIEEELIGFSCEKKEDYIQDCDNCRFYTPFKRTNGMEEDEEIEEVPF